MGRLSNEGSYLYQLLLFSVFGFLFITMKNFNFSDPNDSPLLTSNQYMFSWIFFGLISIAVIATSGRGYSVKTPERATLGMFSLVLVSLGLFIILFNLIWDRVLHSQAHAIGGMGILSMALSSILVAAGMIVYINIKFLEEREQKWFVQAVKDTIDHMEVSEYRSYGAHRGGYARSQSSGRKKSRKKEVKVKYVEPMVTPEESPMELPLTTPTQASPSVDRDIPALPSSPNIIKCLGCSVPIKVPDIPTRPLSIRCPHCGSIATIND